MTTLHMHILMIIMLLDGYFYPYVVPNVFLASVQLRNDLPASAAYTHAVWPQ